MPLAAALLPPLQTAEANEPGFLAGLGGLPAQVAQLDALLTDRVGTASPEFRPLRLLVQALAETVTAAGAAPAVASPSAAAAAVGDLPAGMVLVPAGAVGAPAVVMAPPGEITSRDDAIRQLERVCAWLERHEPSHPAPLLIRRAQRLMRKSFFEIIRDLVPDGVESIERIAGVSYDDATGSSS